MAGGRAEVVVRGCVAELSGLSRSLVYREIERGHLPAFRVGSRLRIEPAAWRTGRSAVGSGRGRAAGVRAGDAAAPRWRSSDFVDELDAIEREREGGVKIQELPDGRYRIRYYVAGHGSPKRQRTFSRKKDAERFAARSSGARS